MPRVHRSLQHPGARADQVEGEALRGARQDVNQAGGQVNSKILNILCDNFI